MNRRAFFLVCLWAPSVCFLFGGEGEKECHWWHFDDPPREGGVCNHFSLSRMGASAMGGAEARERALRCASVHETECVLSVEINVSVPSCFIYDATLGMRMLAAPKILEESAETARVRVWPGRSDESSAAHAGGPARSLSRWVRVEYMPGGSRRSETEVLYNESAWCVQMLRRSVAAECWAGLD